MKSACFQPSLPPTEIAPPTADIVEELLTRAPTLRRVINSSRDCIKILSPDGNLLWMNEGGRCSLEITDFCPLRDANWLEFWQESDRDAVRNAIDCALAGGEGKFAAWCPTQSGVSKWWDVVISLLPPDDGTPPLLLATSRDITDRHEAEQTLRDQAQLISEARDALIVADLDRRITLWNHGAERIFGWNADEVLGQPIDEFIETISPPAEVIREGIKRNGKWRGEVNLPDRTGKARMLEVATSPICDVEGDTKAHLFVASDVTEKKHLELQFYQAQRVEGIGMLASGIAHDLNNILSPIMMAAPLLESHAPNPACRNLLKVVQQSARRGADLVRQILHFTRHEETTHVPMQLTPLLKELVQLVGNTFPKHIRVESLFAPNLPSTMGNAVQLHQVLLNLCVNARDAMTESGTLTLAAAPCRCEPGETPPVSGLRPGDYLRISVSDTGSGMSPELLERIWDPFFTTKAVGRGTGLGLSTVRGIVENHRGTISVETAPDQGTTFTVWLPAAVQPRAELVSVMHGDHVNVPAHDGRILVVDDEPVIRRLCQTVLHKAGYDVMVAANGQEAITLFAKEHTRLDLVITDLSMPELGGMAFVESARKVRPDVRAIIMSGSEGPGPSNDMIATDQTSFLAKPFSSDQLVAKVGEMFTRK